MFFQPINIHDSGMVIEFPVGIFNVYILGGWGVTLGDFTFVLTNIEDGAKIHPKKALFKVQSFRSGKRAKKIFSLDIQTYGRYRVDFLNHESLQVKESNLIFSNRFRKPISKKHVEIQIG